MARNKLFSWKKSRMFPGRRGKSRREPLPQDEDETWAVSTAASESGGSANSAVPRKDSTSVLQHTRVLHQVVLEDCNESRNSFSSHQIRQNSTDSSSLTQRQPPSIGELEGPIEESFECVYQEEGDARVVTVTSMPESTTPSPLTHVIGEDRPASPSVLPESQVMRCACGPAAVALPSLSPPDWPQAPLLLRPKPNGGTKVLGIRWDGTSDYLWKPGQETTWWKVLEKSWETADRKTNPSEEPPKGEAVCDTSNGPATGPTSCPYTVILPINNGTEAPGKSLVVDFESRFFRGTFLLQLKNAKGTTRPGENKVGFFEENEPLRYRAQIRGQFTRRIPFYNLVTGTHLDRPCGKLPPKWVTWTAMKVLHFFAPQLQANLEPSVEHPHVVTPLGSAPRTIILEKALSSIEGESGMDGIDMGFLMATERAEPTKADGSILGRPNPIVDSLERARYRKKQLDKWYMARTEEPCTRLDQVYTFGFLQHLFDYQNFSLDAGNFSVVDMLNGQPLQFMAQVSAPPGKRRRRRRKRDPSDRPSSPTGEGLPEGGVAPLGPETALWAFEIWHESLWADAQAAHAQATA